MKKNLREICNTEECISSVEKNFDSCIKDEEIKVLLRTVDKKLSEERNNALVEKLIVCINTRGGVEYFEKK